MSGKRMMRVAFVIVLVGVGVSWAQEAPPEGGPPEAAAAVAPATAGQLVSLSVSEARIQDVLRSLASMRQGVNIIIDPDVTGMVSFKLEDVPWEMALQLITDAHGLAVTKKGDNIYRVHRPEVVEEQDILIELYTRDDIEAMDDVQVAALVTDIDVEVEDARQTVLATPGMYIKQLAVKNKPAIDVVNALAREAGLNFAFAAETPNLQAQQAPDKNDKAKGKGAPAPAGRSEAIPISVHLRHISVENALKLISEQGGLLSVKQNGVWVVSRMTPQQRQLEPLKMETFQVNFIPVDAELIKICQTIISERGKVTAGKNKILIVKDVTEGIESVRQALRVMDRPTPQVLIEARFFRITDGSSEDLGIDWSDPLKDGAEFTVTPNPLQFDYGDQNKALDAGAVLTGFDLIKARTATLTLPEFSAVLSALHSDTRAKQISNPKLVISSDEQATIHIGLQKPIIKSSIDNSGDVPIQTFELDDNFGGETIQEVVLLPGTNKAKTSTYRTPKGYLDLGTKLTVAPSVKTEDEVYVKVVPELVSLDGIERAGGLEFPRLFVTRVATQFTVKSGQTIAIGGLVDESTDVTETKVPFFGDLPLIGRAFRDKSEVTSQSETVIFLTVKVMAGKELVAEHGVPIRSMLVADELDRINDEDAEGATYSQDRARKLLNMLKQEEENPAIARLKQALRDALDCRPDEPAAAPVAEPSEIQEYLEAVPDMGEAIPATEEATEPDA